MRLRLERPRLVLVTLLLATGCTSAPEIEAPPPPTLEWVPGKTPEAIAERFFAARRDGDARAVWECFAGRPQGKRIYLDDDPGLAYRTYEQLAAEFAEGTRPELVPAAAWTAAERRPMPFGVALVYTQTDAEGADLGSIELRALKVRDGWLLEAAGAR